MGEELEIRVKAEPRELHSVEAVLYTQIVLPDGDILPLSYFLSDETGAGIFQLADTVCDSTAISAICQRAASKNRVTLTSEVIAAPISKLFL